MNDPTEPIRKQLVADLNSQQLERKALEEKYGQVWTTDQLRAEFDLIGFQAPMVVVVRKSDQTKGSLFFSHLPRFYFGFQEA